MSFILRLALKILIKNLKNDDEYYYSYQANMAMAFYDEYCKNKKRWKNRQDIHHIANEGAKNFLNLLIKDVEK